MKVWERYFFREIAKGIFLFLAGCYLIYSLLDYSFRAKLFTEAAIPTSGLLVYYGWQFTLQLELLLPLAVMLTTIRLLSSLSIHRELTALTASGIPLRRLVRPFILVALLCSAMLYLNYQYFYPPTTSALRRFEDHYFYKRHLSNKPLLNAVRLQDGSKLLYHRYDSDRELFHDLFWLRSPNEIVRIKELSPYGEIPEGRCVDHLIRDAEGDFCLESSQEELALESMHFNHDDLLAALTSARSHSISDLWKRRPKGNATLTDRDSELLTQFNKKLAMPLFSLLACLGPLPFCTSFGRKKPLLIVYGLSIIGFVTFLTMMGAGEILGEGHVFSPTVAMWTPVLLFLLAIQWPLLKVIKQ